MREVVGCEEGIDVSLLELHAVPNLDEGEGAMEEASHAAAPDPTCGANQMVRSFSDKRLKAVGLGGNFHSIFVNFQGVPRSSDYDVVPSRCVQSTAGRKGDAVVRRSTPRDTFFRGRDVNHGIVPALSGAAATKVKDLSVVVVTIVLDIQLDGDGASPRPIVNVNVVIVSVEGDAVGGTGGAVSGHRDEISGDAISDRRASSAAAEVPEVVLGVVGGI